MSKPKNLLIVALGLIALLAIGYFVFPMLQSKDVTNEHPKDQQEIVTTNPNGTSELAMVMRKMEQHAVDTRQAILEGKQLNKANFDQIIFAKPTEPEMIAPASNFIKLANDYISALESLNESTQDSAKLKYNSLINKCIACHQEYCGGPLKRIRKLGIK